MDMQQETVAVDPKLPQIHQYQLMHVLGKGGMGVVYEALHLRLKCRVALKIMSPQFVASAPDALDRFEREMAAIGRLSHPNIVRALDAGVDQTTHYLAMEFVDGDNVANLSPGSTPLKIADACEITRQAALGLSHAHDFGIVHRDIKPSNLLLGRDGQVKLADLGLAHFTLPSDKEALTSVGAVLGTYDFMSPEQVRGLSPGVGSDLYSLGATLYRLLAGRPVFAGPDFNSGALKMAGHLNHEPQSLMAIRNHIPADLDKLVLQLLAKNPADRPRSAAEVADRLQPFCRDSHLASLFSRDSAVDMSTVNTQMFYGGTTKEEKLRLSVAHLSSYLVSKVRGFGSVILLVCCGILMSFLIPTFFGAWSLPSMSNRVVIAEITLPTQKSFEELGSAELEALHWYPLLNREPKKLVWDLNPQAFLSFDEERSQLRLGSASLGIVQLGRIDRGSYSLQLDFYQNQWQGEVGILVGFRSATDHDGFYAQRFLFRRVMDPESLEERLHLVRSRVTLKSLGQGYQVVSQGDRGAEVTIPGIIPRMLELQVRDHQLLLIRFGGQELQQLCTSTLNSSYQSEDYVGDFGIYVMQSEVAVSNARIMFNEMP